MNSVRDFCPYTRDADQRAHQPTDRFCPRPALPEKEMIDLSNHNEDLIRDANTWKPLNVNPLERVMVFESGSQSYFVYNELHTVSVMDASRREVSNSYALTEDEFSRLMDELNLD